VTIALGDCAINLPLKGVIDIASERSRLEKAVGKAAREISGLERKLGNQGFLAKAPAEVVAEQRERLDTARSEVARLNAARERLAGLG